MEDADIIAYLYPHHHAGEDVLEAIAASPRYSPPRLQRPRSLRSRGERGSTEPPENQGASALDYQPCLKVRFSDIPRTDRGLVFGSNSRCDVVLDTQGMSNSHFSLTFDEERRLVVQDLGSFLGTQVTYDGRGEGVRRHFRWIVGGHLIPYEMATVVITVQDTISFQIVVPQHDMSSPAYAHRVNVFCQGAATAEGLLDDLGLSNPRTRVATGAHTPGTGEIHLKKKLGEGAFGVVTHLWNVSTASEHVVKEPTAKAIRRRRVNRSAWEREARIMSQVSHPHIVELLTWSLDPYPQLHLEYIPCGALEDHEDITYDETLTVLQQCLSALVYLHGSERPVAHRDIKPANILVAYRVGGDIHVKLGDFGLSRDSSELMTICGTPMYLAPEIYSERERSLGDEERLGYTAAVDIWSLGVVACELVYDLPRYQNRYRDNGVDWCKKIVKRLQNDVRKRPSGLGQFLSSGMLILAQKSRFSAGECFRQVAALPRTDDGGFGTPTPASYAEESQLETEEEDDETVLWQPRSWTANADFTRSLAPGPETLSSSSRMARNRDEASEASEAPPSTVIERYAGWQQASEYHHFAQNYSSNHFDPLYVGSSLAAELGGGQLDSWASQGTQGSTEQVQGASAGPAHGPSPASARRSIPRSEKCFENGDPSIEGRDSTDPDEYSEMEQAALLLQAIAQDHGAG